MTTEAHKPVIALLQEWWKVYESGMGKRIPKVLNVRASITRDHILAAQRGSTFDEYYKACMRRNRVSPRLFRARAVKEFIRAGYSKKEALFYTDWNRSTSKEQGEITPEKVYFGTT